MRPPADYTALHDLKVPGSAYAFAARKGDDVAESVRANAGWVVGEDVTPLHTGAMERPADDADRRAWQDYAVVQGVPYTEAVNLDRGDLRKRVDADGTDEDVDLTVAPEPGDLKARWLDYAHREVRVEAPAEVSDDRITEVLSSHTKAELIDMFGEDRDETKREALHRELTEDAPAE